MTSIVTIMFVSLQLMVSAVLRPSPFEHDWTRTTLSNDESRPPFAIQVAATIRVTGTVKVVDQSTRALEVITGIGHALRLVRMQVSPESQITVAGAAGRLDDVKRGDIVHVEYRETAQANVAERIEVVRSGPQGERR